MEKILMKRLENNNMTLNNHKRYRYGAEFYNFISFRNADLFYFGCQYQCLFSIMTPFVHIVLIFLQFSLKYNNLEKFTGFNIVTLHV